MIRLAAQVWALRLLACLGILVLCLLAGSGIPALAFALAWGPNGLFLLAFMRGALHLPRAFVSVHPAEPMLYRWAGVRFVKRIVANRIWPLLNGFDSPPGPRSRRELLERTDVTTRGAEVCHGATFILVTVIVLFFLAVGRTSDAAWIIGFNVLLNGYPVMLQRDNRWRVQRVRASVRQET